MVFNIALSGIQAASKGLDVIGHNIANASTWGFKSSRAEFQDVFSAGAFGGSLTNVGSGVRLSQIQQNFKGGSLLPTGNSLDMGIDGPGFMVLNDQGRRVYTRAGSFHPDKDGYIVNSNHQRLQGKLANASGEITNNVGDLIIDKANISPKASTSVTAGVNLNSKDKIPGIVWAGGATPSDDSYSSKTTTTVFDSLGNSHFLSMFFIKADSTALAGAPNASSPPGTENQWYVAFQLDNQNIPANVGATNAANLFHANFNPDGSFAGVFDTSGNPLSNNLIPLSSNLNNGSNPLSLNLDLTHSTQYGSDFSIQSLNYDGYTTGKLGGLFIGDDGILFGTYSNNQSRAMGQVQLADFANVNGLQSLGGAAWAETSESGQAIVNNPGTGTLGFVKSGQLEESNVDLTSELVGLINAQRNFQANAQTIKSGDAVTQTIINIR